MSSKTVNISSYSGSVSGGDWAPAMAAAYAAIPNGGTIVINEDIELKSSTAITPTGNNQNIVFQGNGGNWMKINAGSSAAIFNLGNIVNVMFRDCLFIGKQTGHTPTNTVDCSTVVTSTAENTTFDNCHFAGVYANRSLILQTASGDVHVVRSKFGGNGHVVSAVEAASGNGLFVEGSQFLDFDQLFGGYDRQASRGQWISAANGADYTTQAGGGASAGKLSVKNTRFDEGAGGSVIVDDYTHVILEGCLSNTSSAPIAFDLTNVRFAHLLDCQVGWGNADSALAKFTNCGDVVVDAMGRGQTNYRIVTDAFTRLKVLNSPDTIIDRV